MILLISTNARIYEYPDDLDYTWLFKTEWPPHIVGKIEKLNNINFSVHKFKILNIIDIFGAVHFTTHYYINYSYIKYIPKEVIEYCLPLWDQYDYGRPDYQKAVIGRANFLEKNLNTIYDNLMIKDIIE